jgi:hypothetical protein
MQLLHIGNNRWLTVDVSFADGGEPARYGQVGGQTVLLNRGTKQKPEVFRIGGGQYVYKNGQPVSNVEDVDYLPEPFRAEAIKFVNVEKKPVVPIASSKEEAVAPKRGRGRPRKNAVEPQRKVTVIKDEASLLEAAGYNN